MFGHEFYHESIRRYVIIFGTLFNEIIISRKKTDGTTLTRFKVPIAYGPQQKYIAMIQQNAELNRPDAITLPRMSFEVSAINYDPERRLTKFSRVNKPLSTNDNALETSNMAPAPYNIDFTLSIMTKYSEDGSKIIEQILPWFKPEWTSSVKMLDDIDAYVDIPVILTSVSNEEVYEGSYQERRLILWTLTFTMKGYFFGPTVTKKIIKFANTNLYSTFSQESASDRIRIYPGLTSSGDPADFLSEQIDQATATAEITDGVVTDTTMTSFGLGYFDEGSTTVTISDPPEGGTTATAIPRIINDRVTSIIITNGGSGYVEAPTVTISAPDNVSVPYTEVNKEDNWDYIVIVDNINYD